MAGSYGSIDIKDLDPDFAKAWLFFFESALRRVGISFIPDYDNQVESLIPFTIEGSMAAFKYRFESVLNVLPSFIGALGSIKQEDPLLYVTHILTPIINASREAQGAVETLLHATQNVQNNEGIRSIEAHYSKIPEILIEAQKKLSEQTTNWQLALKSCDIVVSLLHKTPRDNTLAVIVSDRAIEIVLKGYVGKDRICFPDLINYAKSELGLPLELANKVENAHRARNISQHEGHEIEYSNAIQFVKCYFDFLEWLFKEFEIK